MRDDLRNLKAIMNYSVLYTWNRLSATHSDSQVLVDDKDPFNEIGSIEWNFGGYVIFRFAREFHYCRDVWVVKWESTTQESIKNDATRPHIHCRAMVIGSLHATKALSGAFLPDTTIQ